MSSISIEERWIPLLPRDLPHKLSWTHGARGWYLTGEACLLRNLHEAPASTAVVHVGGAGTLDRRQQIINRDDLEDDCYLGWFFYTFRKFIDSKSCRGDVVQSWLNRQSPAYDREFEKAVEREYGDWAIADGGLQCSHGKNVNFSYTFAQMTEFRQSGLIVAPYIYTAFKELAAAARERRGSTGMSLALRATQRYLSLPMCIYRWIYIYTYTC